jgi:flagellar assembly protein FliH
MSSYSRVIKSDKVKMIDSASKSIEGFENLRFAAGSGDLPQSNEPSRKSPVEPDLEAVRKQSYDQGFSAGMQKGQELQKAALRKTAETMTSLISQMSALKQQALEHSETQMLHLVLAIAKKIIHREAAVDSGIVLDVVRQAIKHVADRDGMKIRLNPADFRQIKEIKEDFLKSFDGVKNVVFEEDSGIQQGGAVIETRFGEVDARLDRQIEELAASLQAV